ncbi:MAG: ABC transporter ATP-binding protein, partial [Pseudomonas sp.]
LLLRAAKAVHFQPTRRLLTAVEPEPAPQGEILLEARELSKTFIGPDGKTRTVLNQVSLQLRRGETLGVVGESGCGKTTLTRLILGLEAADAGEVWINGQRWSDLDARQKREARRAVQVVFQDPLSSFDPRYTVQRVLFEALVVAGVPRHARRDRALELLELVRLDASALSRRPIELSGGQRQRIAIARALASEPQILICDEPVSALDVSVQAQILELLDDLKRRLGLACLFISHDLGVINHVSERVLVMKAGEVVESGSVRAVFDRPAHAYTRALIDAIPTLETDYTPIPFYLNVAI